MNDHFFLCYFETTRRCNLKCAYCMSRPQDASTEGELTTDEAKTLVLDELAKVSSNMAVAFSGGEHLLRDDAYELLSYANGLGLWCFINTNGKLLVESDAIAKSLEATDGKVVFVLPINSVDAEVNRASRDDSPQTVLKAAKRCEEEGASYFYILTISKGNLDTLGETVGFLKGTGIPILRAPFVPRGNGDTFRHLLFDTCDMERVIHPALTANPLSYISFTPFFASPEIMAAASKRFALKIAGVGCQAGRSFAAVSTEGQIAPCVQLLDSACSPSNVRTARLSEVIKNGPVFTALRERTELKGKCGRCRYRMTCGGCRALAFYHTGDVLAEDPTCFFEPADETTRSPLESEQTAGLGAFMMYVKDREPWKSFL